MCPLQCMPFLKSYSKSAWQSEVNQDTQNLHVPGHFFLNVCRVSCPLTVRSRQRGSWMLMSSNLMQSASDALYLVRVPHGAISVAVKAIIGVELLDRDWLICAICELIAVGKFSSSQGFWKCLCGTAISHLAHTCFFNVSSKKIVLTFHVSWLGSTFKWHAVSQWGLTAECCCWD